MNLKNFFSRKVTCDTEELKKAITKWCEKEGWKFKDFANILKKIDIQIPVKLSEYNEEDYSFRCIDSFNQEVRIFLSFGDEFNMCSKVHIFTPNYTKSYNVYRRYTRGGRKFIHAREIKKF